MQVCPKCSYERKQIDDDFISPEECPWCGVVYAKVPTSPIEQTPNGRSQSLSQHVLSDTAKLAISNHIAVIPWALGGYVFGLIVITIVSFSIPLHVHSEADKNSLIFLRLMLGLPFAFISYKIGEKNAIKELEGIAVSMLEKGEGQLEFVCSGTYYGGHKKFERECPAKIMILDGAGTLIIRLGAGRHSITIPTSLIQDFGQITKEQLTVTRMLAVGVFALALKKKIAYFYIKFIDDIGLEHNPLIGNLIGSNMAELSSNIYEAIEKSKRKSD